VIQPFVDRKHCSMVAQRAAHRERARAVRPHESRPIGTKLVGVAREQLKALLLANEWHPAKLSQTQESVERFSKSDRRLRCDLCHQFDLSAVPRRTGRALADTVTRPLVIDSTVFGG
jgi:hypothetical protein